MTQLLQKLSDLSRDTKGASFVIQHNKHGQYRVIFLASKKQREEKNTEDTDFEQAIKNGLSFLEKNRVKSGDTFKMQ